MTADDRTDDTTAGTETTGHDVVQWYEIRVRGHLGSFWSAWLDGLSVTHSADGTTVISGPVIDQSALHGVLQKLRDVGIALVSLTQLSADAPTTQQATTQQATTQQAGTES